MEVLRDGVGRLTRGGKINGFIVDENIVLAFHDYEVDAPGAASVNVKIVWPPQRPY